jgi:hypothetical protein
MDGLKFASEVIGHLAWPAVALTVFVALRKPIGALAERILELSFGGATVKFDRLLMQGKEIVDNAAPADAGSQSSGGDFDLPPLPEAAQPADVSNLRFANSIFTVFDTVENILDQIGNAIGVKARGITLVRVLMKRGLVPDEFLSLYKTLREARDAVALQGIMPTSPQIREYNRQAHYLFDSLQGALKRLPKEQQDRFLKNSRAAAS